MLGRHARHCIGAGSNATLWLSEHVLLIEVWLWNHVMLLHAMRSNKCDGCTLKAMSTKAPGATDACIVWTTQGLGLTLW